MGPALSVHADEPDLGRPNVGSGCAANSRFEIDNYAVNGPIEWDALSPFTRADYTLSVREPRPKPEQEAAPSLAAVTVLRIHLLGFSNST